MSWTRVFAVNAAAIIFVTAGIGLRAQQAPPAAATCTISGTINGLGGPLPGVSITVRRGDTVQTAGSTGVDGKFKLTLPDASYQLSAELFGFGSTQQDVTVTKERVRADGRSDADADAQGRERDAGRRACDGGRGAGAAGRGAGANGRRGGGAPAANETAEAAAGRRFESLAVNENATTRSLDTSVFESGQDPSTLTPLGFGSEALADAFAVTGEAARVDRGLLNDRRGADFLRPDFDPRNVPGGFEGIALNFQGARRNIDAAALAQLLGRGGNVDPGGRLPTSWGEVDPPGRGRGGPRRARWTRQRELPRRSAGSGDRHLHVHRFRAE